eukprot:15482139-Alexandrium_andersonii.AAC.1
MAHQWHWQGTRHWMLPAGLAVVASVVSAVAFCGSGGTWPLPGNVWQWQSLAQQPAQWPLARGGAGVEPCCTPSFDNHD